MHLGRYGYPDERNFVTNLLPPMTFLLNWKFLRKSLFYGFFPFFTTFFNSSQLHPLFPDLFFQIVWKYFYRIFRHFLFDFFEPDPLKPCHMLNWSSRFYDRNGTKNFKIGQKLSDLWPKEGIGGSGESKVALQEIKTSHLVVETGALDQSIYIWVSRRPEFRHESFAINDFFVKLKVFA